MKYWMIDRLVDLLIDWLIGWLIGGLVDYCSHIVIRKLLAQCSAVQRDKLSKLTSLCPQLAHSTLLFNHFWPNSALFTFSVWLSYIILGRKESNLNHKYLVEFGEWSSHVWLTFVSLFLILCACDHFCFLLLTGLTKCCKLLIK